MKESTRRAKKARAREAAKANSAQAGAPVKIKKQATPKVPYRTNEQYWEALNEVANEGTGNPAVYGRFLDLLRQGYQNNLNLLVATHSDSASSPKSSQLYIPDGYKRLLICYTEPACFLREVYRFPPNSTAEIRSLRKVVKTIRGRRDVIAGLVFNYSRKDIYVRVDYDDLIEFVAKKK